MKGDTDKKGLKTLRINKALESAREGVMAHKYPQAVQWSRWADGVRHLRVHYPYPTEHS